MYAYRTCTVWYALILIRAGKEPLIIPLQGIEAVFDRLRGLLQHCIAFPWNDMPNWVLFPELFQPTFDYVFGTIVCDLDDFDDHWIDVFYLKKTHPEKNSYLESKKSNDLSSCYAPHGCPDRKIFGLLWATMILTKVDWDILMSRKFTARTRLQVMKRTVKENNFILKMINWILLNNWFIS